MGFLDKAREKAEALAGQAKDKLEDVQAKRKADDLLDDLGRILYRQRTNRATETDAADIDRVVAELSALEADGTAVLQAKSSGPSAAPTAESAFPPPGAAAAPGSSPLPPPPPAAPNSPSTDISPS